MSFSFLTIHLHENTATVILSRPERRNALSRVMLEELLQAFEDLLLQKSVRAVVLTGDGPTFCAGMDLKEMAETAKMPNPHEQWEKDAQLYLELIETMLHFPKPIIAAVNGAAVAGGGGLVLASDIVIASHKAQFGFPEPRRGIVAGIVSPLLYFRTSGACAAYLLLTGSIVDADYVKRAGLVQELVEADQTWARARELADECSLCAPEAIAMTKRMLNETIGDSLNTMLATGAAISGAARTTAAAKEGLAAFLEKRDPDWDYPSEDSEH